MSALGYSPVGKSGEGCFTTTNPNKSATGAPGRMDDGRLFTDYRPRCYQYSVKAAEAWGDDEYRARMVHGAEDLMEAARQMNNRKVTATQCVDTMVPEMYKRVCTWKGCKVVSANPGGVGVGRIYVPSVAAAADDPQTLSDVTVPGIFGTYPRVAPTQGSQCSLAGADIPNTADWTTAKSHRYSAPRA